MPAETLAAIFVELGVTILGLAVLARVANHFRFSAIPLYLLGGLAFGKGGLLPVELTESFVHIGAEIGVLLLLFMLGLEYSGKELQQSLKTGLPSGAVDFALNFPPGLVAGFLLGWQPILAVLLGGVTWISSSGVIAKVLGDLRRMKNPETPSILTVLVVEDLSMAVYLPLVAALLIGGDARSIAVSVAVAVGTAFLILFLAVKYGPKISRFAVHESDEIILLSIFGTVLLVAGIAQRLQVSAAIGAFLVGIAASGTTARSHRLLSPLRDLFAATFFFFFGLQIDPATLPPVIQVACILAIVTALTKVATGYWAAGRGGVDRQGRLRAGMALVARGEFSIVIAGLGTGLEPQLGPLSAAYVLILAILGPLLARWVR